MSMLLPICIVMSDVIVMYNCAPKLGPPLFDPLIYESKQQPIGVDTVDSHKVVNTNLRTNENSKETDIKPCQGYDFDETKCKNINNRIICGYNKNTGEIQNNELIVNIGNGCRIRGDRIECGYVEGPFTNPRRPPIHFHTDDKVETLRQIRTRTAEPEVSGDNNTVARDSMINSTDLKGNSAFTTKRYNTTSSTTSVINSSSITPASPESPSSITPKSNDNVSVVIINNTKDYIKSDNSSPRNTFNDKIKLNLTVSSISTVINKSTFNVTIGSTTSNSTLSKTTKSNKATITTPMYKHKGPITRCVEKNDRIFCYDMLRLR